MRARTRNFELKGAAGHLRLRRAPLDSLAALLLELRRDYEHVRTHFWRVVHPPDGCDLIGELGLDVVGPCLVAQLRRIADELCPC